MRLGQRMTDEQRARLSEAHKLPNGKPHKPRTCILCGKEFQWTSTVQKYCPECRKKKERQWVSDACFKRYGITEQEYDTLYLTQDGKCAVCGKDNSGATQGGKRKRMYVDHDHKTGKVRGLLCSNCNMALGFVHDNPELLIKLVEYLNRGTFAPCNPSAPTIQKAPVSTCEMQVTNPSISMCLESVCQT